MKVTLGRKRTPNPWAICNAMKNKAEKRGKRISKDKVEACVRSVKKQIRKKSRRSRKSR